MTVSQPSTRIRFRRWRIRTAARVLDSSRTARILLVITTWPYAYIADRVRRIDPPASLRAGMAWAYEDQAAATERVIRRLNEELPR